MAQTAQLEIPSAFGEPALAPTGVHTRDQNSKVPLEYTVKYLNYLPVDVTIVWRNGMKFKLPRQFNEQSQCLVVRIEIRIPSLVEINADRLLHVIDKHCTAEMRLLKTAMSPQAQPTQFNHWGVTRGGNVHLEYSLSLEDLEDYGGTLYFHELDNVVSLLPYDSVPDHPYSENSLTSTICMKGVPEADNQFGFSIQIVDNKGKEGDRYTNVAGKVFRIPAMKVPGMMDGVYVAWNGAVTSEQAMSQKGSQRFTFEQADEEYRLYRSYAQALNANEDLLIEKKEALANKQLELEKLKAEGAAAKLKGEQDLLKATEKYTKLEAKLKEAQLRRDEVQRELDAKAKEASHRSEMQRMEHKDHYERRSYDRKDSSEAVKFLPGLIVGIGAVFIALKSLF